MSKLWYSISVLSWGQWERVAYTRRLSAINVLLESMKTPLNNIRIYQGEKDITDMVFTNKGWTQKKVTKKAL